MLLEVEVYRMRPMPGEIGQEPLLHAVLLDCETKSVAVHELAVDRPLAVQAVELEGAHDPRRIGGGRQRIESRRRRRVHTVIRNLGTGHAELQYEIAGAGRLDRRLIAGEHQAALSGGTVLRGHLTIDGYGSLTVDLVQAIFEVYGLSAQIGEVDDDLDAFRRTDADTGDLHRSRYQVAVGRNQEKRQRRRSSRGHASREEELVEARRTHVQQPGTITQRRDFVKLLDGAVDQ